MSNTNNSLSPGATKAHNIQAHELKHMVAEARDKFGDPAIAVMLMDSNAVYLKEVQGVRVANQSDAVTPEDFFHIGSTAKSWIAMISARLVEQDKLRWDSRFFEIYPELISKANPAYANITLEDLLMSRAGLPAFTNANETEMPEINNTSVSDARLEFIQYVLRQPPASKTKHGQFQHLYSNPGYVLASAMLERVTGLTYEEMAKQTLEQDLQITVCIGWPNSYSINQPWGHRIDGGKIEFFGPDNEYEIPVFMAPAGNLSMTPESYAKYTQLHLKGLLGQSEYISRGSFYRIHYRHKGFSLAVMNGSFRGIRFSGFDGSATTFFARSIIVPEADFAFAILANAASAKGTSAAAEWLTKRIIDRQFKLSWWDRLLLWLS
ncbi:MAG: beta-lactamase family protein [Gammaproteobacteria bacterium]|nr:beta-lactamase family protein [Gammaproteobacteria bacterium]